MTLLAAGDRRDDLRLDLPRQPRRSPRRRRVTTALLLLPLAAAATWFTLHATYDPLAQGGGQLGFGVVTEGFNPVPQQTISNAFGSEFRVVAPAVGSRLGFVLGLHNTGPFAVEVLDVGVPYPTFYLDEGQPFVSDARGGSGLPHSELEPFTLEADGHRDVGVVFRVLGCPDGGPGARNAGALIAGSVPVTWRWLGRTHVTDVPVDYRAALDAMPVCAPR